MSLNNEPTYAESETFPELYKGLKAFAQLCAPDVPPKAVFFGFQNRAALPTDNEYIVFTPVNEQQRGTAIPIYNDETTVIRQPYEVTIQVDFYSAKIEKARQRATTLQALVRTHPACDFLAQYGFSPLYANAPMCQSLALDATQIVQRWTVEMVVAITHEVTLDQYSFNAVQLDGRRVD